MYAERASSVPGSVLWTGDADGHTDVLPDGCMDVIWFGDHLLVAGPDTGPHPSAPATGIRIAGLRFAPGQAAHVLGVPAVSLRDTRVRLDDVWPTSRVRSLEDRIASSPTPATTLEALAATWAQAAGPTSSVVPGVVELIARGSAVSVVAEQVGIGERQLHRLSLQSFGYGARTLGRILRFTRATALVRSGEALADIAVISGYADQAHLSREVRVLSGMSARELR